MGDLKRANPGTFALLSKKEEFTFYSYYGK